MVLGKTLRGIGRICADLFHSMALLFVVICPWPLALGDAGLRPTCRALC